MNEEQWDTILTYLRCIDGQNRAILARGSEAVDRLGRTVLRRDDAKVTRLERRTLILEARIKGLLSKLRSIERLKDQIQRLKATINALRQTIRRQKRLPSYRLKSRIVDLKAKGYDKDRQIKELNAFLEK